MLAAGAPAPAVDLTAPATVGVPSTMIETFRQAVWDHYRDHGRDLPWRRTRDPYAILVSEVMLQQTQVARVAGKYEAFLAAFPAVPVLAAASVAEVVSAWQGLGYNRRALALHQAARLILADHGGNVPSSPARLRALPGVGPATAAAVCAFAFGVPITFIETNIRAALIHHFFSDGTGITDAQLLPLVESTLDRDDPRTWYYALMDYGVWVKREHANPSRRSRHHVMQSTFMGSRRQLRALVLRAVLAVAPGGLSLLDIQASSAPWGADAVVLAEVLEDLKAEGFLQHKGHLYSIADATGT